MPANYDLGTAQGHVKITYDGGDAVNKATTDIDRVGKTAESTTNRLDAQRKTLSQVGTGALVAGGVIAAGFGYAVKSASDFQFTMSAVQAVSGATSSEMKQISDAAIRIGADTSFSAAEAGNAFEELVKAGVSVKDALGGAADATVALAAAGQIDLPQAAALASNAMNQFNLSAAELPKVADLIAGAANASAIDVGDFGQSLSQVGAVANLAGASFDDTAAAIALMGNAGIKGSDAGTSLKTMLMNLNPQTKKARDLMSDLGIITADGSNQFYDAQGNLKSLADVSQILQTALAGQTSQQKQATLATLFGSDAIRGAAILANNGAEGFDKMAAAMTKVSAADVAKTRLDNFQGSLEQLKGSIETVGIVIGQRLLPALTNIIQGITSAINVFSGLPGPIQLIVIAATAAAGAMLLFAGVGIKVYLFLAEFRAALLAATAAQTVFGAAGALAAVRMKAFAAAQAILNAVLRKSPLILIAATIALLVAGFIKLYNSSEPLRQSIATLGQSFMNVFKAVGTVLPGVSSAFGAVGTAISHGFGSSLTTVGNAVVGFLIPIILQLATFLNRLVPIIVPIAAAIASTFAKLAITLIPIITGLLAAIGPALIGLVQTIGSAFGQLAAVILPVIGQLVGQLAPAFGQMVAIIAPLIGQLLGSLLPAFQQIFAAVVPLVATLLGQLLPVFIQLVAAIAPLIAQLVAGLLPVFVQLIAAVVPVVTALVAGLLPVFTQLVAAIAPLIAQIVGALLPVFAQIMPLVAALVQAFVPLISMIIGQVVPVFAAVIAAVMPLVQTIIAILIPVIQALLPVITTVFSAIVPIIQAAMQIVQGVIQVVTGLISGNWSQVWNGIKNIFMGVWNAIKAIVTGAINIVRATIAGAVGAISAIWNGLWSNFPNIVRGAIGLVGAALSALRGIVTGALSAAGSWLISAGRNIIEGLINGIKGAVGAVADAARSVASSAINAAKSALGIKSPSRVFFAIGGFIGQGLVNGLGATQKKVAQMGDRIAQEIVRAFQAGEIDVHVTDYLNRANAAMTAGLARLAASQEKLADRLKTAQKNLTDLRKERDKYAASVKNDVLDDVDASDQASRQGYIMNLQDQIARVKQFSAVLAKLKKNGVDKGTLDDLVQGGVDSLPIAQSIAEGGKAAASQISKLRNQLNNAAGTLGNTAASTMYKAGIDTAAGLVRGIESQQSRIAKAMKTLADNMVNSIRRALDIHSPSRVMRDQIGVMVPAGISAGVLANLAALRSNGQAMMQALMGGIQSSTGALNGVIGDVSASIPLNVTQQLSRLPAGDTATAAPAERPNVNIDKIVTNDDPVLFARAFGRAYEDGMVGA